MGFHQTDAHKNGKGSYHQIGLVRGQFGGVPEAKWIPFLQEAGFDGWEEASWELDLRKCDTDAGAAAYAAERVGIAKKHGLEIFTVASHLQGQVLGDEPSAKTLNFCSDKGEAKQAYKAWRDKGNKPPRTDPYYVPDDIGRMIHQEALRDMLARVMARDGYDVVTASNGELALDAVAREKPDLVLMDVNMPAVNGVDVCRHLKREAATRLTPVSVSLR